MGYSCCFTGYRPHRFEFSAAGLRPEHIQRALTQQITRLYAEGYRDFYSGMCIGVDLWAAQAVVDLSRRDSSVRLIGVVPFDGQDAHWSISEQRDYRRLIDSCAEVVTVCTVDEARRDAAACYRKRNRYMVDSTDTVLAVYTADGSDSRSGTGATVRYAQQQHKRILYIHPTTLRTAEETVHQLQFPL